MNRIFWNGNESHSRNLGVSPAGMAVAHSSPSPSLPSQEQRAYDSYVRFSRGIGAPVMDFDKWYAKDSGIGSSDIFQGGLRFHGHDLGSLSEWSARKTGLSGRYEPPRREWNGAWDNAVKALEG